MAAVAVPPSPQVATTMSNRRVPLANLQNATNSPLRANAVGGKRQRSHASEQRDIPYGQPPPKKQLIEVDDAESRRHGLVRRNGAPQTALTRKLEAARDGRAPSKQVEKNQQPSNQSLENIRLWQRHYRKMFPQFVFYFEGVPDDIKYKLSKKVHMLGSHEVKFFSREASHVVTTRLIPPELDSGSSAHAKGTINPAQFDSKKNVFDTALQKSSAHGDILYKAKELGMKIWTVEKLQRMIDTMFNAETGEEPPNLSTRHTGAGGLPRARQDLQKLLENERVNGPSERDFTFANSEMIQLRGCYIYVHDMDEATRPVMVREYNKVGEKERGKWPQFRSSGAGKCPFVEDLHAARKQLAEQEEQRARKAAAAAAPRTRAATALEDRRALGENNNLARRPSAPNMPVKEETSLEPPRGMPPKRSNTDGMPPMFGSAQASIRSIPRFVGGEPVASGLQQSNITSAIRSQMVSSTAAAPGARAGNSKEVNQLKRKVLEKNSVPSAESGQSSAMNDIRAALNKEHTQPTRAAKRKAQETLGHIQEDAEEDRQKARKPAAVRRQKTAEKELKPGYCENCREKFNDFDEHVVSRKHRKFATTAENWAELDQLLAQLTRV